MMNKRQHYFYLFVIFSLVILIPSEPVFSESRSSESINIEETLTKLGNLENGSIIFASTIKTNYPVVDSIAFAIRYEKEGKKGVRVFNNGNLSPVYDTISKLGLIFSPDGKRMAYISRTGNDVHMVIDDKKYGPYDTIANFVFSPDSNKTAYLARDFNKNYFLVENGKKGPEYKGIFGSGYPMYSPDSSQLVYPAYKKDQWVLVINGKETPPVDQIRMTAFSPDSKHFCYVAKNTDSGWFYVRDGVRSKDYDEILTFKYSPDSNHILFVAKTGDEHMVILDDTPQQKFEIVSAPIFSPDSKRIMYSISTGKKCRIVVDGKKGPWVKNIGPFIFSPDSSHYAYVCADKKKSYVIMDKEKGKKYDSVSMPVFSSDSSKVVYNAKDGEKEFLVVNTKELKKFDGITLFNISPDSQHIFYIAKDKDASVIFLDNEEIGRFDKIGMAAFTPDSRHLVYQAFQNEQWFLMVDRQKGKNAYKGFVKKVPFVFSSPNSFHTLSLKASEGPEFYVTHVAISEK